MFPKKERVETLLKSAIKEMELLHQMSQGVQTADDFVSSLNGMVLFRACGMSLQYITESFVKIRNLCGADFFKAYSSIPWPSVGRGDKSLVFNSLSNCPPLVRAPRKRRK